MNNNLTVNDLVNEGESMDAFFRITLGFDIVDFEWVKVSPDENISFIFTLYDDFQRNLPSEHRVEHEAYRSFSGETITDIWASIRRIPNRERRELLVMAKQLAGAMSQADKLVSLAGQEFAAKLKQDHADLYTLLEAPAAPDLDDEIPF